MLVAYIDEIGETGAFVSKDHPRFNTSAAFGYAGFVLPEDRARRFGSVFNEQKRRLFRSELARAANPAQWEKKGSDMFRARTSIDTPQFLRVFRYLVREVTRSDGRLFYYADEKTLGTPKQVSLDTEAVEAAAMQETLNRLCRHAHAREQNILVMIDQVNESQRSKRLPNMYGHILGRVSHAPEMKRIIEPPMHVDSILSSNIQFADWVAAFLGRAVDRQLLQTSPFTWIPEVLTDRRVFTFESKLHLRARSVDDILNSEVLDARRRLWGTPRGQRIGDVAQQLHQVHAAAQTHRRSPQ